MTAPTKVHAATVSKLLATKFPKSSSAGTAVRGYRRVSPGFKVVKPANWTDEGKLAHVEHVLASGDFTATTQERVAQHNAQLNAYAAVLSEAGYKVSRRRNAYSPHSEAGQRYVLDVEVAPEESSR